MKIACLIVAAGDGTRLGDEWSDTPKALVPILGRPMLYYSLNAFDDFNGIDGSGGIIHYVITAPPNFVRDFEDIIGEWGFSVPYTVVKGGATRSESVINGLNALKNDPPDIVMIHDCARCCLNSGMVKKLVESVPENDGGTLAHPVADTLRLVEDNKISGELEREKVASIETPQIFPYAKITELHTGSTEASPDDTTLFTRSGGAVRVVYHDGSNMKVTYAEDVGAVEGILYNRGWVDAVDEED